MARNHRATTWAIFIETIYRHAKAAFRTRPAVDAHLDHCISGERGADYYYREKEPHNF